MKPDHIRNNRIQVMTRMALNGATELELLNHAKRIVAPATARNYVDEVKLRIQKIKKS